MSKKIAVLITDDFEDSEFTSPAEAFKLAGHQVITIEKQAGKTVKGKQGEAEVAIDRAIDDVTPGEFDALLLPGGYSPDQLRGDERFVTFTRAFVNGGKPVFAICHGPQLLAAAGCDALVFGAETPDAALLMEAARVLSGAEYRTALKARLAAGARSFAAARQAAVEAVCPGTGLAALLDKPNNNLAVEYCKAILELGASLVPIPLPRQGAGHGQALTETGGQFASASALRTLWQNGGADAAAPYVPAEVLPLYREAFAAGQYTDLAAAQRCQLALLRSRCAGTAPFAQVRGISEGLEHRLEAAVRSSTTHAELLDSLTTVRYPRARMRRLAMDAALDYSADAFPALPPYLHLLGAQKDALPLLKAAALPVSHSLARLAEQSVPCRAVVDAQLRACDFGALCRKKPEPMGNALRQKIIFLTK